MELFYHTFQSVKILVPMQFFPIISRNSPSMDQTILHYLNICYTTLLLAPDNMVSFRKTVSTNLRQSKLMLQWYAYNYVTTMTLGVTALYKEVASFFFPCALQFLFFYIFKQRNITSK